jgi:hypothetical protein
MRKILLTTAAFFTIGLSSTLQAASVFSENFDGLTTALGVTSAGGFTAINGTNVDIVGVSFYNYCNGPASGNCIDMNGTGGNPQGQLQSNMLFAPGNYVISFDLIGMQRGAPASVTVTLGNYNQTFNLLSDDFTTGVVVNAPVTITTAGYLLFASNTTGLAGLLLDNVNVSTAPLASVPEPSTTVLLGSTALLGGFLARRRRQS